MPNQNIDDRDIFHDNVGRGLTQQERAKIQELAKQVVGLFVRDNTDPELAFTTLLNVLGSLIGTQFTKDRHNYIAKVQMFVPMYVEAYRLGEKRL